MQIENDAGIGTPKSFLVAVPDGGEEKIRDAGLAIDIENAAEPEEVVIKKKKKFKKKKCGTVSITLGCYYHVARKSAEYDQTSFFAQIRQFLMVFQLKKRVIRAEMGSRGYPRADTFCCRAISRADSNKRARAARG